MVRLLVGGLRAGLIPASLLLAPVAALAQDAAVLRVYSSSGVAINWFGIGPASARADLCVVSTTGRYRLEITSASGGHLVGPGALPFTINFRDASGAEQSASTQGRAVLHFEGSGPPRADCDAGPNAQLQVRLTESEILQEPAGSYSDQLRISVSPL